jgi:GNAT superfamily N-acetyltransferase
LSAAVDKSGIDIGSLKLNEQDKAVELMRQLRISVGGLEDPGLYRALSASSEICSLVARDGSQLAGIALVEISRRWIWRHPFLLVRMLMARLRRNKGVSAGASFPENPAPPFPLFSSPPLDWKDRKPRVLFIGVHPDWRGKGIGKALYFSMFDAIRSRGYDCILARIALDNTASLYLHEETGWVLYEGGQAVLAIRNLRAT